MSDSTAAHPARATLVEIGQRMHQAGFAAGSDGNLSVRLDDQRLLITPSGFSKGHLRREQLLLVDLAGTLLDPVPDGLHPSSEMAMHLEAYRQRPDVRAVIHAHPPLAIACSVANISLAGCVLPEIIFHLGRIPTAPYATPGTPEGARAIRQLVQHHDAILLARHGSLTLGATLAEALMRLEWVEQAAQIMLAARAATAEIEPLPAEQSRALHRLRRERLAAAGRAASADASRCSDEEPTPR